MAEELTVIIVALLGADATDQCLRAVRPQTTDVLVVRRDGSIVDGSGRPIEEAGLSGIPAKRRRAVELALTPLVALLEDTVIPGDRWAEAVRQGLGPSEVVACGGPVRIGDGLPAASRALALSEYGTYGDRRIAGDVSALPGCNFAFRRDALLRAMDGTEGLVDLEVFKALKEVGGKMVWAPDMAVTFAHAFPDGARLKTRFDHGRLYASSSADKSRLLIAAKAFALPGVLTFRSLRSAREASPSIIGHLLLQHTAWAAGEFVGAVVGPPPGGFEQWQ